jgi:DNA-binding protein YbaB
VGEEADRLGRYGEMKIEIAAIKVSVSSADRAVTVVAGPGGAVLDVRLSADAFRAGSAHTLSGTIMSTLRLAVADAARRQAEIVQRYVGDRLNIVDRVLATQQELFGDRIAEGDAERERLAATGASAVAAPPPPAPAPVPVPGHRPPAPRAAEAPPEDGGFSGLGGRENW